MTKKILNLLNLKYNLIQFKFGRKYYGGSFYLIHTQLCMGNFWSNKRITSCGSVILNKKTYN